MNMATTGTVQRDDAAECRQKFEESVLEDFHQCFIKKLSDGSYASERCEELWLFWQSAWKAARGE